MGKVVQDEENQLNQVTSEADIDIRGNASLPSPSVDNEPLSGQSGVLHSSSSDSGEVVGAVGLAPVLAFAALGWITNTHDEEDNDDDDHANDAGRATTRSFLMSSTCSAALAFGMIASVAFLVSLFIFYPNYSGQGGSNANVNYVFTDGYNETNATQMEMEIEEDTLSIIMKDIIFSTSSIGMEDTLSPSPTFSPTALDSGSPSVSPSAYPIASEADEDTFITTGETQKQGNSEGKLGENFWW